jgi:hypothetical protein
MVSLNLFLLVWVSYKADDCAIPETIHDIRESTLNSLLDVVYQYVERFSNLNKKPMCRRGINVHHCHSIMFGSLVLELQKLQLWPGRKSPSEIFSSLQEVEDGLKGITILLYPATTINHTGIRSVPVDHSPCLFMKELKDRVDSVLNNTATVVQDFHTRHLEAQHSKCAPMVRDD